MPELKLWAPPSLVSQVGENESLFKVVGRLVRLKHNDRVHCSAPGAAKLRVVRNERTVQERKESMISDNKNERSWIKLQFLDSNPFSSVWDFWEQNLKDRVEYVLLLLGGGGWQGDLYPFISSYIVKVVSRSCGVKWNLLYGILSSTVCKYIRRQKTPCD